MTQAEPRLDTEKKNPSERPMAYTVITAMLGFGFPAFVLLTGLQFFLVPAGESISPMGWVMMCAILSQIGLLVVVPTAFFAWFHERRAGLCILAALSSLTPVLLGRWLLLFASRFVGFQLAP